MRRRLVTLPGRRLASRDKTPPLVLKDKERRFSGTGNGNGNVRRQFRAAEEEEKMENKGSKVSLAIRFRR
jgi:hypothetical protein